MAPGEWHSDFWAAVAQLGPVLLAAHIVVMVETTRALRATSSGVGPELLRWLVALTGFVTAIFASVLAVVALASASDHPPGVAVVRNMLEISVVALAAQAVIVMASLWDNIEDPFARWTRERAQQSGRLAWTFRLLAHFADDGGTRGAPVAGPVVKEPASRGLPPVPAVRVAGWRARARRAMRDGNLARSDGERDG